LLSVSAAATCGFSLMSMLLLSVVLFFLFFFLVELQCNYGLEINNKIREGESGKLFDFPFSVLATNVFMTCRWLPRFFETVKL